jgi:deoxyuridine 5'-triphosphate nucleotidohydrolase
MLQFKKLDQRAKAPTCSHIGFDLGFDVYSIEYVEVNPHSVTAVRTGISAQHLSLSHPEERYGLVVKDRSSMAKAGLFTVGGVIDASYTGEIIVLFRNVSTAIIGIHGGEKIAQLLPIRVMTQDPILEVQELPNQSRGSAGFGSSDKVTA